MGRGAINLQGGREFGAACRAMDLDVLTATPPGPVVLLPGAAASGRDYDRAGRNGAKHYADLSGDVSLVAPDPRHDLDGCLDALERAAMIVLPGGSPTGLLAILTDLADGVVGEAVSRHHADGVTVSGSSAGAMVLGERCWRPDGGGDVAQGLGLVPGLVLPHWDPDNPRPVPVGDEVLRWGLPECGGVLVTDAGVRAVGRGQPVLVHDGVPEPLPRDSAVPLP